MKTKHSSIAITWLVLLRSSSPFMANCSFSYSCLGQLIQKCSDIKSIYPQAEDGEYRITLPDGNQALIYCHNVAGSPREYITLHGGPRANFATNFHFQQKSHTVFQKIGLNLGVSVLLY